MTTIEERVIRNEDYISEIRTHFATKADLWRAVAVVVAANAVVNRVFRLFRTSIRLGL